MRLHVLIVTLLLLGVVACGSDLATSPTVVATAAEEGGEVRAKIGQILVVQLESNPTTGYSWEVSEVDDTILRQIGDPTFQPESDLLGAGGTQTFQFRVVRAGETLLRLVYRRSWEQGVAPLREFWVRVIVG